MIRKNCSFIVPNIHVFSRVNYEAKLQMCVLKIIEGIFLFQEKFCVNRKKTEFCYYVFSNTHTDICTEESSLLLF